MERPLLGSRSRLSGFTLKRIAIVSMLIDHIGSVVIDGVVAPYRTAEGFLFTADMPFLVKYSMYIRDVCEALGSVAFPIFCFLIAEGFLHTRDRVKYGLRLGLFALLSEIPYDLAHYQSLWSFRLQNVLFTLCVGVFTLVVLGLAERRFTGWSVGRVGLTLLIAAAGMGLAFLLRGEYVFLGVAAIVLLYLLRDAGWFRLLGFAPLLVASPWILLALIPVVLYSGQRGRGSKYFFYVFYPAHFLVLAGLAWLLAQRAVS